MSNEKKDPRIPVEACSTYEIDKRGNWTAKIFRRFEPRTCRADYSQALSFEVHDPMWMLTRQWQFGRFRANDCGTAIKAKVTLTRSYIDGICQGQDVGTWHEIPAGTPWESEVECMDVKETLAVRVQSAVHLKKMIRHRFHPDVAGQLTAELIRAYKLDVDSSHDTENDLIAGLVDGVNTCKTRFASIYGSRIFDGCKVYRDMDFENKVKTILPQKEARQLWVDYSNWFRDRYHPERGQSSYWNPEKIGYDFTLTSGYHGFVAEDYSNGHVGWYTFDGIPSFRKVPLTSSSKSFSFIPVKASFPAAPARRLWEYENRRVHFGNLTNKDVSQMASAVMMQYVSLYSNDWMIMPVYAKPGMIIDVEKIEVTDCFGITQVITRNPQDHDNNGPSIPFSDRWSLFGISSADAYKNNDFSTVRGMLFPASLLRTEESEPIEEVQFLRDEMANMVWGVELRIDDECGGSADGKTVSDKVLDIIDEQRGESVAIEDIAEFTYLVQNRVPVHWIPFLPVPETGPMGREIRFRRGRMPLYYKDDYRWVRPNTSILGVKRENGKVIPFYLNEEEILAYGTKVTLTDQRTRWIGGKSFQWRGYAKKISGYQANSGLMFDELRKIVKPQVPRNENEGDAS